MVKERGLATHVFIFFMVVGLRGRGINGKDNVIWPTLCNLIFFIMMEFMMIDNDNMMVVRVMMIIW